jgi:hypothetical protein
MAHANDRISTEPKAAGTAAAATPSRSLAHATAAGEPQYDLAVFKRLIEPLQVAVLGDTLVPVDDMFISPNYDIRDDGVWLRREDQVMGQHHWTPACELDGPNAPDPLTTPALSPQFKARHLAVFMLGGWGYFLGERYGVIDERGVAIDPEFDAHAFQLLGLVSDVKPREALSAAWQILDDARKHVGELDVKLGEARRKCRAAKTPKARDVAAKAEKEAEGAWRKAVVQYLIEDAPNGASTSGTSRDRIVERQRRRLERFRTVHQGNMRKAGNSWQCIGRGALAALVREEKAARHPMSDKKNVREDLIAAIEAELNASGDIRRS